MSDFISHFQALGIDTKSYNSGSRYVRCPNCSHVRKKKNSKCLLINFSTGYYECFHGCGFKGFASSPSDKTRPDYSPPPKAEQKFLTEPVWNWKIKDSIIEPVPEKGKPINGRYSITWFYRDINGRITSAKKMAYDFVNNTFNRVKDEPPLFLTTRDGGYYPSLFYEHDLAQHPKAKVFLVEAEKTAALLRHKFVNNLDEFIYIACGGTNGLTSEKLPSLSGREIIISFDCDQGELMPDGTIKNPKGRDAAKDVYERLKSIASPKIIDIDPSDHSGKDLADIIQDIDIDNIEAYASMVPEKLRTQWHDILITQQPPPETPFLAIDNISIATPNNYSLVVGKKKTRKTLFMVMLVSQFRTNHVQVPEILIFDTEQGRQHVWRMREKIKKLTNQAVSIFYLRGMSHAERRQIIADTVKYWATPPKILIIDGIRDLMSNINDPDETTELITWLEKLTLNHNLHIINVLHLNKTDSNARGHIGSELLNKSQITIELELDTKTNYTLVKCESSRDKPFDTFAFTHNAEEMPEIVGQPLGKEIVPEKDRKERLESVFQPGVLKYADVIEGIKVEFGVGTSRAKTFLAELIRQKWVMRSGPARSKDSTYKLLSTAGAPKPVQMAIVDDKKTPVPDPDWVTSTVDDDLPF